ncbi:uncharacterized protein LOC125249699 [Megalobrama amblycephala]|uniref:uncharacterized protein LOC125249699 n=1 Tax=Megalobrama amblycephala TaxID=75352 RepID=UPI0020141D13|nr:uncharacterized protein LOC125249699 [Megalobrama amblycephala]
MGRYKKRQKLKRSGLWEEAGGTDSIIEKLQKADILNRNTEYSSDIWSELALSFFSEDSLKNRRWCWTMWTKNRNGLRERLATAAARQEIQPRVQDAETSQPVYQEPTEFDSTLQTTPTEELLAGSMTECLSKKVLKVIRSEIRKQEYINTMKEIFLMQTIFKDIDERYFKLPGYIQHFGMNSFSVHLYTELGINILVHHLQSRSPVCLYLDATGGVVSKIPEQPNPVLYYALTLPGNAGRDAPPLPICELLSNDDTECSITYCLMQFTFDLSKYTQIKIHQVETDYSWALIKSVMLAFNNEHISAYLNRAYDFCTNKKSVDEMKSCTVLHICSAHILQAVRQAISRQTDDKGLRDFATYAFARLQNASNMTESRMVFRALCALLTTQQNTDLVKESLCILESVISRSKEEPLEETPQSEDWEMCESEDRTHATTISGKSPFYAFFQQIMEEVKEEMVDDGTGLATEDNPYFCPGILTVLFDTYLAIFPLWSGLLLGDLTRYECHEQDMVTTKKLPKTRDTNCHTERWFGIVKHSIMHKGKKVNPGVFIRKMRKSLQERYREHIIKHELPQKLLCQPEEPLNLDQSQETWKKEECFPSTKSKFFSVPQKVPAPPKKIVKMDVEVETSSSDACQLPAEVLHVDEEIHRLWKKEAHTELLVAVVRSPSQDLEFLLHHKEFNALRPHEWLFGETIECYFRALLNKKDANLYQLSHFTTGVVLNGTREQMEQQGLRKVNFEQYDGVITFANITQNHWRFVFLHAQTDTLFVLDSLSGTNEMQEAEKACQKFGEFFQMRRNLHGREHWVDKKWKPATIQHSFQEEGCSCAVFVMLMAKQVVEEFPKIPDIINITPSKEMMCHYRENVAKDILLASVSTGEYCSVCGQKEIPPKEEQCSKCEHKESHHKDDQCSKCGYRQRDPVEVLCNWIQCAICLRWYHVQCLNIKVPPEQQSWMCNLCS